MCTGVIPGCDAGGHEDGEALALALEGGDPSLRAEPHSGTVPRAVELVYHRFVVVSMFYPSNLDNNTLIDCEISSEQRACTRITQTQTQIFIFPIQPTVVLLKSRKRLALAIYFFWFLSWRLSLNQLHLLIIMSSQAQMQSRANHHFLRPSSYRQQH